MIFFYFANFRNLSKRKIRISKFFWQKEKSEYTISNKNNLTLFYHIVLNMENFSSNCYGFTYAWLENSDEEYFKCRDDLKLKNKKVQWTIKENIVETSDEIVNILTEEINQWWIIELFDHEKRSQHVAFLDNKGNFFDQNGPDGEIRLKGNLDDLLFQYKELFGKSYFQVYSLNPHQERNVTNFLKQF